MDYGKELIIDLHDCDVSMFTRENLDTYFKKLCFLIDMEKCERFFWDDLHTPEEEKETEPHLVGVSAVQFIKTSNITIHTLTLLRRVYLNIFSCKEFDSSVAMRYTSDYFSGQVISSTVLKRI